MLFCPVYMFGVMTLKGFWSYVREDDKAEGGRIAQLGRDIGDQFRMLTNEELDLFLDRDSIDWGDDWGQRIETALANVAFVVPILTPRYFASSACRTELNTISRAAEQLGVRQLLMPILYLDFPGIDDEEPEDELVSIARSFNWVDMRETGLLGRDESGYRKAVREMAQRLAAANREAESSSQAQTAATKLAEMDTSEGYLDVLARFEDAVPDLTSITRDIAGVFLELTSVAEDAGAQLSAPKAASSFAYRLRVTRDFARNLAPSSKEIGELGEDFSRKLHDMDTGVRLIIERAPLEPEHQEQFSKFFAEIKELAVQADIGLSPVFSLVEQIKPLESASRELRPVTRELMRGLTLIGEGRDVIQRWADLIDEMPTP